ncbi:MAG TPA: MFS transporter [Egibacteraceae bacterium]|nr:MFS transporter [Egibacteraceae bacterium]
MAADLTRERWTLTAVVLASSVVFLDSTLVGVALPRIAEELGSGPFGVLEAQSYVYNGYLLTLSALLVLAGAASDRYGRRRMFLVGLAGFTATSVACGLAPSMPALIVARLLQGASGAVLVPGSLALIASVFTGARRGWAYGVWAAASAATTILGPLLGGALVDTVSWRAAFLLNVPLLAVAIWATLRHVPESRDEEAARGFDWLGAALIATGLGGLTYGAIRGQEAQWQDTGAFVALAVGALATALFVPVQARRRNPLVPLGLFRERNFAAINASTLLIYGALYVASYLTVIHLQGTLGYSATAAGVALVPMSLLLAGLSSRFGALAARLGPRRFLTAGPLLMAAGLLWLVRMPADSAAWDLRPASPATWPPPADYVVDLLPMAVVFGLGLAVMVAPLTTALMASIPPRHAGLASAINNAISRVGPQLAGAAVFVAVTAGFYADVAGRAGVDDTAALRAAVAPLNAPAEGAPPGVAAAARGASARAHHQAMAIAAGLLAAGAAVNGLAVRDEELRLDDPDEAVPQA